MPEASVRTVESLYVHVPFCAQKCSYCAFYSEASSGELINRYVEALVREMEMVSSELRPRTVFFGGGTPSILNLKQWRQVLEAMERLSLLGAVEWTVECNPATVSLEKAQLLREFGVNRISMGVQSLDEALLDRLGRVHSREMVFKSFDLLRQAGFDNVNLDLMFAIPGQTLQVWRETLEEALALRSEHLSSYEVIYEEDTALYAQLKAGEFAVDEDLACAMYDELLEQTAAAGLQQYEIANFARSGEELVSPAFRAENTLKRGHRRALESVHALAATMRLEKSSPSPPGEGENALTSAGKLEAPYACSPSPGGEGRGEGERFTSESFHFKGGEREDTTNSVGKLEGPRVSHSTLPVHACLHNVNYWRGGSFYGLGPSATSYVHGVRTKNYANTRAYCDQLARGERPIESREELAPMARAGEIAAFGLRMPAGWLFEDFERTTSFDLRQEWKREMIELQGRGWATISPHRFHLTPAGLRFADAAAELFLR